MGLRHPPTHFFLLLHMLQSNVIRNAGGNSMQDPTLLYSFDDTRRPFGGFGGFGRPGFGFGRPGFGFGRPGFGFGFGLPFVGGLALGTALSGPGYYPYYPPYPPYSPYPYYPYY